MTLSIYRDVNITAALESDEEVLRMALVSTPAPSIASEWTVTHWQKLPTASGRSMYRVYGRGMINEAGAAKLEQIKREAQQ